MELQRLFRKCPDMDEDQRAAVMQLVDRLVNKFMHPCVSTLRRQGANSVLAGELHAAADKERQRESAFLQ
jgi:glutamyl-tRNA reductase